jgi:hypothetical protein
MKFFAYLAVAALGLLPNGMHAFETANARIWCLSLRFSEGTDGMGDTLDLGTLAGTPNGELMPVNLQYGDAYTYGSGFVLDQGFGFPVTGSITVQIPSVGDANNNGFEDFLEVSQGVNATTSGTYDDSIGGGTVRATWSRAAGSMNGTCVFSLEDSTYGPIGDFTHTFQLIEYTGPLTYTPGSNTVTGIVNLVQTGNPANQFTGPVQFNKVAADRFNDLILQAGTWNNSALQSMPFFRDEYLRTPPWTTNYYGYFDFVDGDLTTAGDDYTTWTLSIDDTNDVNHNGIPDFSDDPSGSSLPRRPLLSLARGSTNFWLTIHGDVGHLHTILQVSNIISTNWLAVTSINLTTDPQTISLPLTGAPRSFWRVLAQ